jgi:TRAP-type C4-dicarboxylate transport system permease small subunit
VSKLGRGLRTAERALVRVNQALIVVMMMTMATLVFANVVSRYLFAHSLNWSEEIARYMMIWITYLGAGLAMRGGQHVAIEFGQSALPKPFHPWIRGLVAATILLFLGVLTVAGVQFTEFAWRQRSPVMQWPMGAVYLAIPIGSLLFALHFLAILRDWIGRTPGVEAVESATGESLQDRDRPRDPPTEAHG